MIFVTVGGQMPFDRLVRAVDRWAADRGRDDVVAQVGPSDIKLRAARVLGFLSPPEYERTFDEADVIVAHAGMGTILTALTRGKPLLILPRQGDLRETRNDHQIATARHFRERAGVYVAMHEDELAAQLDALEAQPAPEPIPNTASPELITAIRDFVHASPT